MRTFVRILYILWVITMLTFLVIVSIDKWNNPMTTPEFFMKYWVYYTPLILSTFGVLFLIKKI